MLFSFLERVVSIARSVYLTPTSFHSVFPLSMHGEGVSRRFIAETGVR
jgi:hypothetical protein